MLVFISDTVTIQVNSYGLIEHSSVAIANYYTYSMFALATTCMAVCISVINSCS